MQGEYQLATTPTFERAFRKLNAPIAQPVMKKLKWLSAHPEVIAEPLHSLPATLSGLYKYRIGDYRVLFWIDHSRRVITLYTVKHRSVVYKNL
ncbi:MAG: type II toxin-antitoxin system RelE family toxin [Terriglobia bacterium]